MNQHGTVTVQGKLSTVPRSFYEKGRESRPQIETSSFDLFAVPKHRLRYSRIPLIPMNQHGTVTVQGMVSTALRVFLKVYHSTAMILSNERAALRYVTRCVFAKQMDESDLLYGGNLIRHVFWRIQPQSRGAWTPRDWTAREPRPSA